MENVLRKKVNKKLLIYAASFFLFVPFVLGLYTLDEALKPIYNLGLNQIGEFYLRQPYFLDAILYFMLFIGTAKSILSKTFKDNTSIGIIMGIILSIGMAVFEYKTGFYFGKLYWLAAVILFSLMALYIYKFVKGMGGRAFVAFNIAFLAIFIFIQSIPGIVDWIRSNPIVNTVFSSAYVISLFGIPYNSLSYFSRKRSGALDLEKAEKRQRDYENGWGNFFDTENKASAKTISVSQDVNKLMDMLAKLENDEAQIEDREIQNTHKQVQALDFLDKLLKNLWNLQNIINQLQYNKANPEFAEQLSKLPEYVDTQKRTMDTIRQTLLQLKNGMDTVDNLLKSQLSDIEKEVARELKKLIIDLNVLDGIETNLTKGAKETDAQDFHALENDFNKIKEEISTTKLLDVRVQQLEQNLKDVLQRILALNQNDAKYIVDTIPLLDEKNLQATTVNIAQKDTILMTINLINYQKIVQTMIVLRRNISVELVSLERNMEKANTDRNIAVQQFLSNQKDIIQKINEKIKELEIRCNKYYELQETVLADTENKDEQNESLPDTAVGQLETQRTEEAEEAKTPDAKVRNIIKTRSRATQKMLKGRRKNGKISDKSRRKEDIIKRNIGKSRAREPRT
jgi:hypothetical protein